MVITLYRYARKVSGFQINYSIVAGRWQEPYSDGTKPWDWTGSTEILEQFLQDPTQHVKYGQCWVFSGVLVTRK